jgi:hypothetical protein
LNVSRYTRLRQICLVAPHLEPVVPDLADIMGLEVCYRDPNVAKYGLENALLPVDTVLLEVVAPVTTGTAAERFIEKTGGRGGYMAIFCCDDPDERAQHAASMGVRTANVIDHPPYHAVQLHPRDCRAAFIEFSHTEGSNDESGPYPPAGPDWQRSIRKDVTQALVGVEMQSPEPAALAGHWAQIIGLPTSIDGVGECELRLPNCSFHFVRGPRETMSGLTFRVSNPAAVCEVARAKGYAVSDQSFPIGGVTFRLAV